MPRECNGAVKMVGILRLCMTVLRTILLRSG